MLGDEVTAGQRKGNQALPFRSLWQVLRSIL